MPKAINLKTKPSLFRFARAAMAADTAKPQFEAEGGMYGAGLIRNVSVITEGEALGHGMWIDGTMIQQTHDAIVAAGEKGVKSRFTHPGMSSDGLGKHLGRIANSRVDGKSVIADLHFTKSAHSTPEGDLAEYVTLLVAEDETAAGLSIVFDRDYSAESQFLLGNGATVDDEWIDASGFKSPDPANSQNYPHARLASLRAVDVVDEPAANPDGMFDSMPIARDADAALAFALGLEKNPPQVEQLAGVSIERAAEFFSRFFASRGLVVVRESELRAGVQQASDNPPGADVADNAPQAALVPTEPPALTRDALTAELSRYTQRFGAVQGVEWYTGGKSYQEALELHCDALAARDNQLSEQVTELTERLQSLRIGETEPLNVASLTSGPAGVTSISQAKAQAASTRN